MQCIMQVFGMSSRKYKGLHNNIVCRLQREVIRGDYSGLERIIQRNTIQYIVLQSGLQWTTKGLLRTSESNTKLYRGIHDSPLIVTTMDYIGNM